MDDQKAQNDERTLRKPEHSARQTYRVPKLTEAGKIAEITGGPSTGTIDGLFGGTGGFQNATS